VFEPFTAAAKEEMLSAFVPWSADECIRAFESRGKKPHQGVAPENPALHQGIAWSNSTSALGLRTLAVENRVGSRCTGKERDAESGLDEFGARYYGSSLGRFMTPDWATTPIDVPYADFGNPQSLNLYSYVKNNPTTTRDPDGHCPDACVLEFLAVEGGIAAFNYIAGAGVLGLTAAAAGASPSGNAGFVSPGYPSYYHGELQNADGTSIYQRNSGQSSNAQSSTSTQGQSTPAQPDGTNGLPKPPTGKGSTPPEDRDPKRTFTKSERQEKLDQQNGKCAQCGKDKTVDETNGHHVDRHADGGQTNDANHAEVCKDCHKELHKPDQPN
jgi:RHS repeat-associated protein